MEKETEQKENPNGSFVQKETITTTPEDGLVSESVHRPTAPPQETYGKYRYGYSTTKTCSTNDPRVTRTFVWAFCAVFMLIGLFLLSRHRWIFASLFLFSSVFCFVRANKDINKVVEKLKKQGKDVTIDSPEELKEVVENAAGEMKTSLRESAQDTFTNSNRKSMTKLTLPFFIGITVVVTVALSVFVSIVLGIVALVIMSLSGLLFYGVLLKLLADKSS